MGSSLFDGLLVGAQPSAQLARSTPYQLRALVIDYLAHQGYTRTAAAFVRESTVRHLDADGDEIAGSSDVAADEMTRIEQRKQIYHHIQCGRVDEATALLKSRFPTVLAGPVTHRPPPRRRISDVIPYVCATSTDPTHLALNLRVQAFIEACRTRPLHYPPRDDDTATEEHSEAPSDHMTLLNMAQKLFAHAQMLPGAADRSIFLSEVTNVGGLLVYKVPEESTMRKYLAQERRDAVAEQVDRAILESSGICSVSSLELLVRYTSSVWYFANRVHVKPPPGAVLPPQLSPTKEPDTVPIFDLGLFLDQKT